MVPFAQGSVKLPAPSRDIETRGSVTQITALKQPWWPCMSHMMMTDAEQSAVLQQCGNAERTLHQHVLEEGPPGSGKWGGMTCPEDCQLFYADAQHNA